MTTSVFNTFIGPGKYELSVAGNVFYNLDDSNDAVAKVFCVPSGGNITDVGLFVGSKVGTPPEYKVGITVIDPYTSNPTQSPYGGSQIYSWTPVNTSNEWIWFTLPTSASGVMGDVVAIHVYPSGTTPNTSNYTRIERQTIFNEGYPNGTTLPFHAQFSTSWITSAGWGTWAIKYDDGNVFGIPASNVGVTYTYANSTPDELGNKFTLDFDVVCDGFTFNFYGIDSGGDYTFTLYDNNDTIITQRRLESSYWWNDYYGITGIMNLQWESPVNLQKDANYRLTVKSNRNDLGFQLCNIVFESASSKSNNIWEIFKKWSRTERTDGGSWTDYNDRVVMNAIKISGIEITAAPPASGAGGGSYAYIS